MVEAYRLIINLLVGRFKCFIFTFVVFEKKVRNLHIPANGKERSELKYYSF